MSAGLYSLGVIAEFLGKRPEEISTLIKDDGLPAIKVPTPTKNAQKVSLLAFHRWLAARSLNDPLTVDDLEQELDRAATAVADRLRAKKNSVVTPRLTH